MDVDLREPQNTSKEYFNGAIPIKRARMDLTSKPAEAAQLRRQKEAEREYGRGRKIRGMSY